MSTRPAAATILGLLLVLASPCLAHAATLLVSPIGTDSDTCGIDSEVRTAGATTR